MAFFPDETALLTWMDDSSGLRSVHRNGKGLNAADSYLGRLVEKDGAWGYELKGGEYVKVGSYANAHKALEVAAISKNGLTGK